MGPVTHTREDLPLEAVIETLCERLEAGGRAAAMPAGLVLALLRHHEPGANERLAALAAKYLGHGVVGLDIAGDELNFPDLRPHARAFAIAREGGLGVTAHAAEAGPADAAFDAHEILGVTRIGHGTRAAEDADVLARAADAGLCFEVCPTSNVLTGAMRKGHGHPAARFLSAGCEVVLGDDIPQQTGSPLSTERRIFTDHLGLRLEQVAAASAAAIERAFCDDLVREQLREVDAGPA